MDRAAIAPLMNPEMLLVLKNEGLARRLPDAAGKDWADQDKAAMAESRMRVEEFCAEWQMGVLDEIGCPAFLQSCPEPVSQQSQKAARSLTSRRSDPVAARLRNLLGSGFRH